MIVLLHSGQSGVERGAHQAAVAAGFRVDGVMPPARRDEYGDIPRDVACHLSACADRGARPAVLATLDRAHALVLLCPNSASVHLDGPVFWIIPAARRRRLPYVILDPETAMSELLPWIALLPRVAGDVPRVYVTGPRATRWAEGERIARRTIRCLSTMDVVL